MRVLLVHPFIRVGGAERIVLRLARFLSDKGVDAAIATLGVDRSSLPPGFEDLTFLVSPGHSQESVRSYRLRATLGVLRETMLLRKLIRRDARRFTILNPHNFPAMWACAFDDRPTVWMVNEPPNLWANPNSSASVRVVTQLGMPIDALLVRRFATRIVSCSEWTEAQVGSRYGRASTVLYPGVDYDFYNDGAALTSVEPRSPGDRYVLVQVGELIPKKNQLASVRAVHELVAAGMTDLELRIIGKDTTPYGDAVRSEIERLNLRGRVQLLGWRSDQEVRSAYRAADLLLFPSQAESFGLAPLEALCAGTPCVVSPDAGVSSIIRRIGGGVVSRDLSEGIRVVREHEDETKAAIPAAQRFIRGAVSWDVYCNGMLAILQGA